MIYVGRQQCIATQGAVWDLLIPVRSFADLLDLIATPCHDTVAAYAFGVWFKFRYRTVEPG